MVDEVENLDWPWWGREAMLATVRLTLLLRERSWAEAEPLLELAALVHPQIAADARTLVSVQLGTESGIAPTDTAVPQDWAWLCGGCIHAQAVLAKGDRDAIQAAYDGLLPASGMIAATGSFDAGPVDGYLAELATAVGLSEAAERHREQLARMSAREGLPH